MFKPLPPLHVIPIYQTGPFAPTMADWVIWSMLFVFLFVFTLILFSLMEVDMKKFLDVTLYGGTFVFMVGLVVQLFPYIDRVLFTRLPALYAYDVPSPDNFGAIHTPTLILGFLVAICAIVTPAITRRISGRANVAAATGAAVVAAQQTGQGD